MLRRTLLPRRLARYEREFQKSVDKEEGLKPLRLARRAPSPGDAVRLLWPYAQNVPLYEALTVPSVREMLVDPATVQSASRRHDEPEAAFFSDTFSETPPMPCTLPHFAMATVEQQRLHGGDRALDGGRRRRQYHQELQHEHEAREAPSRTSFLLDAVITVKGLEKTDLMVAATPLLDQLQPALRQHSAVEPDCLRLNLPPALSAPAAAHHSTPAQKPLVPTTKDASFFRTVDDTYGDEAVRVSRLRDVPLESVEYFVGFSDAILSLGALHRVRNDRDRRLARVSFGCSHALQHRMMHPQLWCLARVLDAFWNSKRGGLAAALGETGQPLPFAFTVSLVSWAVAAGALSDSLPGWLDSNRNDQERSVLDQEALLAVAGAAISFLEHAAWSGATPVAMMTNAADDDADTDAMTSAELLATLRARSFGKRRRQDGAPPSRREQNIKHHANKSHYVWRNFFLPCERFETMPPIAALQQELVHRGAATPRAQLPRPTAGDVLVAMTGGASMGPTEDHGREVPDLYFRKVFTR